MGRGSLPRAARLVAAQRGLPTDICGSNPWERLRQMAARARAGRHTRWVNTELRALALEPGFLIALYMKGLWSRLFGPRPGPISLDALLVSGDRWTADVVARLEERARTAIVP